MKIRSQIPALIVNTVTTCYNYTLKGRLTPFYIRSFIRSFIRSSLAIMKMLKWFGLRKLYWLVRYTLFAAWDRLLDVIPIFPHYHQSLVKRPLGRTLIHTYSADEGQNINFTQYFLGFGLIHYAMIRNCRPDNILCIGSRKGFIPAILALACRDNGKGHVDFVDAGYDQNSPSLHWSGIGFWKKHDPKTHFAKIGVTKYISTYVMTTDQFARTYSKKYRYVYIDGDHSYSGALRDYNLFWPRLQKGGLMVFHDIVAHGYLDQGLFGVWKLWNELKKKHAIELPFPQESGLGILQK